MKILGINLNLKSADQPAFVTNLKIGIWLYYLLLIFEGALRKWVFPGLASPLLVVRDPVVIVLILIAIKHNILRLNGYLLVMTLIGLIGFVLAIVAAHGNLYIALYGARILVLHFPLMFIIQKIFTKEDVILMGKFTLLLAIPMAVLITMQFYSPQTAWVNRVLGVMKMVPVLAGQWVFTVHQPLFPLPTAIHFSLVWWGFSFYIFG